LKNIQQQGVPPVGDRVEFEEVQGLAPPKLKGRTVDTDFSPKIEPAKRISTKELRISMRAIALKDSRVSKALGERYVFLRGGTIDPEKGTNKGSDRYRLVYYSYSSNRPVQVQIVGGERVEAVNVLEQGVQPSESREEVDLAARLVRSDEREKGRTKGLDVSGIQTPSPEGNNRRLYLIFSKPGLRAPVYQATVDMTANRVVDSRPVSSQ
jgi:hypothetical protein